MVAEGATMLSHLREQADAGTEAVLGASEVDDAAVVILQRLGFPRSRHRTQVCSVALFSHGWPTAFREIENRRQLRWLAPGMSGATAYPWL